MKEPTSQDTVVNGADYAFKPKDVNLKKRINNCPRAKLKQESVVYQCYSRTSYNRVGRDDGKATLSEQQMQVQESIHYQVKNFWSSMDEILFPDIDRTEELGSSVPYFIKLLS